MYRAQINEGRIITAQGCPVSKDERELKLWLADNFEIRPHPEPNIAWGLWSEGSKEGKYHNIDFLLSLWSDTKIGVCIGGGFHSTIYFDLIVDAEEQAKELCEAWLHDIPEVG